MQSTYDKIWESAVSAVKVRMLSSFELRKKLEALYPGESESVSQIINEMQRVELINDNRYAHQLMHHLTLRPVGRFKIMIEARKRGIDKELTDAILLEIGYDEEANAAKALEQKEPTVRESDPRKRKFKLMNFLKSRGFTDTTIWHVLR